MGLGVIAGLVLASYFFDFVAIPSTRYGQSHIVAAYSLLALDARVILCRNRSAEDCTVSCRRDHARPYCDRGKLHICICRHPHRRAFASYRIDAKKRPASYRRNRSGSLWSVDSINQAIARCKHASTLSAGRLDRPGCRYAVHDSDVPIFEKPGLISRNSRPVCVRLLRSVHLAGVRTPCCSGFADREAQDSPMAGRSDSLSIAGAWRYRSLLRACAAAPPSDLRQCCLPHALYRSICVHGWRDCSSARISFAAGRDDGDLAQPGHLLLSASQTHGW